MLSCYYALRALEGLSIDWLLHAQALECQASFVIVFPVLRAMRFGQAYAAGKSFLQTGRPGKSDDSTPCAATATGGGSDDAGDEL